VTAPDEYHAEAHVTATGLDELMKQAHGNPQLEQALPFLAIARGFAQPEGDHLVWDIVAGNGGLTVNGIPLGKQPDRGQPDKR
jgi:stage V sporulation protein SpoVS